MISIYEMRELVEETSGQESGVRSKKLLTPDS
jgi:hypothetical protein